MSNSYVVQVLCFAWAVMLAKAYRVGDPNTKLKQHTFIAVYRCRDWKWQRYVTLTNLWLSELTMWVKCWLRIVREHVMHVFGPAMAIHCLPGNGISREYSRGLSLRLGSASAFGGLGLGLEFCWAVLKPSRARTTLPKSSEPVFTGLQALLIRTVLYLTTIHGAFPRLSFILFRSSSLFNITLRTLIFRVYVFSFTYCITELDSVSIVYSLSQVVIWVYLYLMNSVPQGMRTSTKSTWWLIIYGKIRLSRSTIHI